MKGVMYHYIRPTDVVTPNLKYLHVDDFELQLDFFEETYGILSKEEWAHAIQSGKDEAGGVILTFDDGLIDHYDFVYPILKRRGLWGIFYVSSGPLKSNSMLDVHIIHYLLGRFDANDVLDSLKLVLNEAGITPINVEKYSGSTYQHQNSNDAEKEVKRIVNYYLEPSVKRDILLKLFELLSGDMLEACQKLYMSPEHIKEMAEAGFSFGGHAHTHTLLSNLDQAAAVKEVDDSINALKKYLNKGSEISFCYPYGGKQSYTESILGHLEKIHVPFAFSVEARDINSADLASKFELPRYDCNVFPYGQVRS